VERPFLLARRRTVGTAERPRSVTRRVFDRGDNRAKQHAGRLKASTAETTRSPSVDEEQDGNHPPFCLTKDPISVLCELTVSPTVT
jgi:hypothetical protein